MIAFMTPKTLGRKIINKEPVLILDIRKEEAFEDWKIEGETVRLLNEPYTDLRDGIDSIKDKFDKNDEIVIVCGKGVASQSVTEMFNKAGFKHAYTLEGGMSAWSEHVEPVKLADLSSGGELYQFIRLGKGCLSYMIISGSEAAVIDPARIIDTYLDLAARQGAEIQYVLDTHLHADHISGGKTLSDQTEADYYLPAKDGTEVQYAYTAIEAGDTIKVGETSIDIHAFYSPGHTSGSMSYIIDDAYLLTGDILFTRSIGRPDLAGQAHEWVEDLHDTLYKRYRALSQDLIVLPAHYSFPEELKTGGKVWARLGDLYLENEGLKVTDAEKFRKMVTENLPPQPHEHQAIREVNMGKQTPELNKQKEMESGPNRCSIEG